MIGRHRSVGIRLTEQGASFAEFESVLGRIRMLGSGALDLDAARQSDSTGRSVGDIAEGGQSRRLAKADQVILGIPRHDVVCRFIDVPNVGEDQLDGLLAFEIERHVPFPVEEACYSYRIVSSSGPTSRILIMAAKRRTVEEALARVERLGIIPTAVDVSSMAATTALLYQQGIPAGQTVTLVQVESGEATVDVFSRDVLVSSRTVPLGGEMTMSRDGRSSVLRPQKNRRVAADWYLTFVSDALMGEGEVVNVSGQGLCVRSDEPVIAGMVMQLSVVVPEMNDPLDVTAARVQWVGNGMFGLVLDTDHLTIGLELQRYVEQATETLRATGNAPTDRLSPCQAMRLPVEGYVAFSGDGVEGEGTALEVSTDGWRIESKQAVKPGMLLAIEAALPELNAPIAVMQGRVQWTRDGEFGVHSTAVEEESRVRLLLYLGCAHPGDTVPVNVSRQWDALVTELKRVATGVNGSMGPTLLHGGDDRLGRSLREELGRPVDRWDTSTLSNDPGTVGLALRGLPRYAVSGNLLPPERRAVRKDTAVMLCWSLLLLVSCLSLGWWVSDALLERRVLNQLHQDIQHVSQEAADVKALQQEASAMKQRLNALEKLASMQGRSMRLLREVVTLLPPDVVLQELSFDGAKVRLRGSTTASAAILISAFEQSALLENASFTAPISVQGKDRQAFEISATLRVAPRPPAEQPERGSS